MLEPIFGSGTVEKILFFILINNKCYGTQLSKIFGSSLAPFQKAFDRLEKGGVLVSFLEGKTRLYQFNPRYPFLLELKIFLEKAYSFLPKNIKEKYYDFRQRSRPRRRGKPL